MECENKYENGKIYKIVDNTNGDIYIGSTINTLEERLTKHKCDYKKYIEENNHYLTSFEILKNNDYKIELLEKYPCNSKKELETKEREYIENNICINKSIPTRTRQEYYEDNKEHFIKKQKIYAENNKEQIKNYMKNYLENNREKFRNQEKKYREKNKILITCECGQVVQKINLTKHKKTKKHINYINSL